MTPLISTGRERRVKQQSLAMSDPTEDRRTGTDRRVASYRNWISGRTGRDTFKRDLILALRKPESVVVAEGVIDTSGDWPVIRTGGAFGVIQFASWLKKDAQHGHCVRVVVEKCDE